MDFLPEYGGRGSLPERESRWHCGDCKRRRALEQRFAQISSIHGTTHIGNNKHTTKLGRIFYRVLLFFCFIALMINIVSLIQDAMSKESVYNTVINKDMAAGLIEDPNFFPGYPRLTICSKPTYRTDLPRHVKEIVNYASLALGYPFPFLTPIQLSQLVESYRFGEFASDDAKNLYQVLKFYQMAYEEHVNSIPDFNLTEFIFNNSMTCEDLFGSCVMLVYALDCCSLFHPVLTTYGVCFVMIDDGRVINILQSSPTATALEIDMQTPRMNEHSAVETGFTVILSDPYEPPYVLDFDDIQNALPSYVTTISAELVKIDRTSLHMSFDGMRSSCPGKDVYHYSVHECRSVFLNNVLRDTCKCNTIYMPQDYLEEELKPCGPEEQYQCLITNSLKTNLTELKQICQEPCVEYRYKCTTSYMGLGDKNLTRVRIIYNFKQFMYHQFNVVTFSSILSQIGGALGLYIGASIITVVELGAFILTWLWYALQPTRTVREKVVAPQWKWPTTKDSWKENFPGT